MSVVLWVTDEEGISLGPTIECWKAFAEMVRVAPHEDEKYGQLWYVPHTSDETMDPEYIALVRAQAAQLLDVHSHELSEHATWILERLVNDPGSA